MSTEKEPDYKSIALKMASEAMRMPSEQNSGFDWYDDECDRAGLRRQGYASCMEARLRSDWETIRLLKKNAMHDGECGYYTEPFGEPCTCGLDAHLSRLLEPFTP